MTLVTFGYRSLCAFSPFLPSGIETRLRNNNNNNFFTPIQLFLPGHGDCEKLSRVA